MLKMHAIVDWLLFKLTHEMPIHSAQNALLDMATHY